MTFYVINILAVFCLIDLIALNYKRGLFTLTVIITCGSLFFKTGIPGINLLTLLVFVAFIKPILKIGLGGILTKGHLTKPILFFIIIVLCSYVYVSFFTSIPNYDSLQTFTLIKNWVTFILLYILYVNIIDTKDDLGLIIKALLLGIFLQTFIVFKEFLLTDHRRLHGLVGNSNDLGTFFAAFIFVCFFCYKHYSGIWKHISLASVGFCIIGLGFSLSRGAYLGFLSALIFYGWEKSKKILIITSIIIIICSGSLYNIVPSKIKNRIESTFLTSNNSKTISLENSARSRLPLAIGGFKMFLENPIWGKGFGTFHLIGMEYYGNLEGELGIIDEGKVAHNMYIQVLAEMGLIGFFPLIIIYYRNFKIGNLLKNTHDMKSYIGDVGLVHICINIAFAVTCLFGNRLFNGYLTSYFWIFSAIVYKYSEIEIAEHYGGKSSFEFYKPYKSPHFWRGKANLPLSKMSLKS